MLPSEFLTDTPAFTNAHCILYISSLQSENLSRLCSDVLSHLINALDWSPAVPYTLTLGEIYTLSMQQLASHDARPALLSVGECE